MPALSEHFVGRPRVRALLTSAIHENRVCVMTAAAGSGKTSALVEACREGSRKVAWLTLDTPDEAPGRLLTYLEAALSGVLSTTADVATSALAAGAPHVEAAGLLAEAIDDEPMVIVLDETERIGCSAKAWDVIEALVRYKPADTAIILCGREDVPARVVRPPDLQSVTFIGDDVLAFTVSEADDALVQSGRSEFDAPTAVSSTGGWVAGVLFQHAPSETGRGRHALRDYLAADVIGRLPEDLQEFLTTTSLLGQVTAERAEVFGYTDAGARLAALRPLHLPVVWDADARTLTLHAALREHLIDRLGERSADEVRAVRLHHARLLAAEGLHEEAVEAFLRARALEEAVPSASRAITPVVRRLDFAVAERWLTELADFPDPGLVVGRLLIALAHDDLHRAAAISDRARADGVHALHTSKSEQAGFLMIWSYLHHARWADVNEVLAEMSPGQVTDAVHHGIGVLGRLPQGQVSDPAVTHGPAEVMVNIGRYGRGQLTELTETSQDGWDASLRRPWRIAAMSALGHTREALREYRAIEDSSTSRIALLTFAGPDLLMDAGANDEARRVITEGIRLATAGGSLIFQGAGRLAEARYLLRVDNNPAAAHRSLDAPELQRAVAGFQRMEESADMFRGLAYLKQDRDEQALQCLRRAVSGMVAADRILELPAAAIYLAEAEWRTGDEAASDQAADLALASAQRQGSNHLLLQAIEDLPTVLTRRLDAEAGTTSPWHDIGRARMARVQRGTSLERASIVVHEFGRRELIIDGSHIKMPIGKSYELLGYLLTRPGETVHREMLLSVLFDDRQDASSRSYLRQTIRWLKAALPEGLLLISTETIALVDASRISSDATRLTHGLAEAAALQGVQRLEATLDVISIFEHGPYLPGVRSAWADERERELGQLVTESRAQVAGIALDASRLDLAITLARQVLEEDSGRELAWQIVMRAAEAIGDQDGVTRAYRECEGALADLGIGPSPTTKSLLNQLRR